MRPWLIRREARQGWVNAADYGKAKGKLHKQAAKTAAKAAKKAGK